MFEAPYCWCCGKKEHFNGYGCNNPECNKYYKLKELKQGAKNTEQPTIEEACKAALLDCVEALEAAQPYVESSGWTRSRYNEAAIIQAAIDKAREVLG